METPTPTPLARCYETPRQFVIMLALLVSLMASATAQQELPCPNPGPLRTASLYRIYPWDLKDKDENTRASGPKTRLSGHFSVFVGDAVYTTENGDKWPNSMSGDELGPGVPGGSGPKGDSETPGPGNPGPRPWPAPMTCMLEACPNATTGYYSNNICVAKYSDTGALLDCQCEISLNPIPFQGIAFNNANIWDYLGSRPPITGVGTYEGLRAEVFGRPESGYFVHAFYDDQANTYAHMHDVVSVGGDVYHYEAPFSYGGITYTRLAWKLDSRDNKTVYEYVVGGVDNRRLARIKYPNGLDKVYDYDPSWISTAAGNWHPDDYSGIEARWEDPNDPAVDLSHLTTYTIFERAKDASGNLVWPNTPRPFAGDRLYRVYERRLPMVDAIAQGKATYDLAAAGSDRYSVVEFSYYGHTGRVFELKRLIAATINNTIASDAAETTAQVTNRFGYVESAPGSGYYRVAWEETPLIGGRSNYSYVWDSATASRIDQVTVTDESTNTVTVRTFDDWMRLTSETVTPASDAVGMPRTAASEPVTEPAYVKIDYSYGSCSSCTGKPTQITHVQSGRVEEFDYDQVTGLMKEHRVSNPNGTGLATTKYTWAPLVPSNPYGEHVLKQVEDALGAKTTLTYTTVERQDVEAHGWKVETSTTASPAIVGPSGPLPAVSTHTEFDVTHPVLVGGRQNRLVGNVTKVTDGDGVEIEHIYDQIHGYLESVVLNPSGSADKIQHGYVRNRRGFVTQETRNESSTQPLVITRDYNSGDLPSEVSMTVGGVPHEERFYYDMYGNLAVHLTANLDHTGAPPDDFGSTPRQDSARSWIRNEWHYLGGHLLTEFRDRRPLDRDADGAEYDDPLALYQRSDYIWRGDGALLEVALPNGASRGFVVDGYGTIYKDETRASSGTDVVLNAKYLVDASLDVVRVIDGLGAVTTIERNVAGVIESVTQPATTVAPPNYAYSLPAQLKTEFDTNAVGQLTEVRQLEAGSTTPLVRRTFDYDAIGRRCRAEVFSGASATALQEFTWVYEGATKLKESHTPGGRYVKRTFDALARVSEALDSLDAANGDANPNKVIYSYVDNAPFVAGITRRNIDGAATSSAAVDRVTTYERDELGRVTKAKVGSTTATLDHSFGYYTTGATAVYTDPEGKLERFLPDALGRIRERFLPGTQPIWNGTIWRDWTGTADQLERDQVDGLGHVTTTIMDFAGRTRVLMEPGSTTQPTPANKHQANAKFYEYDAASRLSNVYLGDDVHIAFDRDAAGRLLQRRRLFSQANVLVSDLWGGDRLRRNALGQIVELSSYTGIGPGGVGKDYINEEFLHDVVGRTLWEDFEYGANVSNRVRVTSEFVGGDPFRTGLSVVNSIGSPSTPSGPSVDLHMQFVPDAIGRVASISWKADGAAAAPWVALADYTHEGGLTRTRKTTQGLGVAQGATPFDFTTTYSYDDYGRMEKIEHSYGATPSYEFVFDDSSNLVKEKYAKQSGAVGDRFSYDEHNRLLDAWLDSDAQHFAETDPNSGIGTFVKKLTYGLDQANNRDTVTENGVVESYALEAGSNRYSQVGADPMAYDSRGNTHLTPDGCYLVYDANNRLTEVYKMVPQEVSSGASAPQEGSTTTFAVTDYSALDTARTQILQRLAPRVDYLLHIPDDAQVRADSKQGLSPSVAQSTTTDSSGASSQDSVVLEMVAFYLYDPMNRRVVRWVRDDATYYYAYDGWEEVQRYGLGSATTYSQSARGEQFDELIAYRTKVDTGAWVNRYVAEGGAHCPMRILDEAGNEVEVQEYDPYGRATYWASGQASGASSVGMSYGWRMMVLDPETGLYYVRNRFYSAELGRFCSKDPLGVDGDPATWLNAYNFGSATPLTQNDPLGLQVFLSQLVDELGLNPGERAEFDQTQTSPSGKPFDGVGRDVDGTPYAFTDSVGRLLFPIGDFQATSHWFWKGTWHLLNGATAGIPGMLTSDPHGDLCAETASDYILEEVGGLVPWAAMFSWLKWGDRASDAVKALDRAGDAVRNADNAADASRGAQGTLNFGRRICFEAGTQVNTPDGSITIESVEAGDEVYAYDETSGEVVISRVVRTFAKRAEALVDLTVQYSGSGRSYVLSGTPEHPFYVPELGEYVAMGELEAGAILRTTDGITARVVSSRLRRGEFDVFNFEVEGEHNYFVSPPMSEEVGILVHNDCFDLVRKANNLPRNARLSTNEADIFARLAKHNGIDPKLAGSRLHDIKAAAGRGGADNVIFDFTGNVFSPQTGELLGSLTQGGARVIR